MKKMNNKGFAISTMLYGLLILIVLIVAMILSIMAFNRKNSREFSEQVVDDLENRVYSQIVAAYTYDATTCPTGAENTCVISKCYKNKTASSCNEGDIIDYYVNDTTIMRFHVMKDDGTTMTMQSQENIVTNTPWVEESSQNDKGPTKVLDSLINATSTWSNVNNQNYSTGGQSRKSNACDENLSCNYTKFELSRSYIKARLITVSEASSFNAVMGPVKNCPKWVGSNIWTSEATYNVRYDTVTAWYINGNNQLSYMNVSTPFSARAVVVINK